MIPLSVIIGAAGEGTRMQGRVRKPFLLLQGEPVLLHSLRCFLSYAGTKQVIVAARRQDFVHVEACFAALRPLGAECSIVQGGASRQESVAAALARVQAPWVMVHDAARPLVPPQAFSCLLERGQEVGAATLAIPVTDTMKEVGADGLITRTVPRQSLYAAQTPQFFATSLLRQAYAAAARRGDLAQMTDDTSLVEALGEPVAVVTGEIANRKLTFPADIAIVESLTAGWKER